MLEDLPPDVASDGDPLAQDAVGNNMQVDADHIMSVVSSDSEDVELVFVRVGSTAGSACQHDIKQFYSPPRLVPRGVQVGLRGFYSCDLATSGHDFLEPAARLSALALLRKHCPQLLMLSPSVDHVVHAHAYVESQAHGAR